MAHVHHLRFISSDSTETRAFVPGGQAYSGGSPEGLRSYRPRFAWPWSVKPGFPPLICCIY
jgi:hypothetical protein